MKSEVWRRDRRKHVETFGIGGAGQGAMGWGPGCGLSVITASLQAPTGLVFLAVTVHTIKESKAGSTVNKAGIWKNQGVNLRLSEDIWFRHTGGLPLLELGNPPGFISMSCQEERHEVPESWASLVMIDDPRWQQADMSLCLLSPSTAQWGRTASYAVVQGKWHSLLITGSGASGLQGRLMLNKRKKIDKNHYLYLDDKTTGTK